MRINRDNYEEYFLLYLDNELSEVDKKAVESYLQQNPDLVVEMEMLVNLRLRPDENVQFDKKELLHHKEIADTSIINSQNYPEYLLSYVDNELNFRDRAALEEFLTGNPQAGQELEILKMTKLEADPTLVFKGKTVLYRTSRVPSKLAITNWRKVAVAATVIIVAGMLWITLSKNEFPGTNQGLSQNGASARKDNVSTQDVTKNDNERIANDTYEKKQAQQEQADLNVEENKTPVQIAALEKSRQKDKNREQVRRMEKKETIASSNERNEVAREESKSIPVEGISKVEVPDKPAHIDQSTIVTASDIIDRSTLSADVKTDYASEALLSENLTPEPGLEETQQKKGLFRGLIRRANRVFNKVTNPEPGKPVVRVANFELALAK